MNKIRKFKRILLSLSVVAAFMFMAVATGDISDSSKGSKETKKEQSSSRKKQEKKKEQEKEPDWNSDANEDVEIGEDDPIFEGGSEE